MQPWHQRIDTFARKKSVQITFVIIAVVWFPFLIRGWIYNVRQSNTWDVQRKMNAAINEFQKEPLGLQGKQKYVARLKAIDNPYAPDDLKKALADYISAFEASIEAMKVGVDAQPFEDRKAEAQQRIIEIEKRYNEYR